MDFVCQVLDLTSASLIDPKPKKSFLPTPEEYQVFYEEGAIQRLKKKMDSPPIGMDMAKNRVRPLGIPNPALGTLRKILTL